MCGIIGFLGSLCGSDHVFDGLRMLLNRGYDSVGICGVTNNNFIQHKYASQGNINAFDLLVQYKSDFDNLTMPLISHSRWATHGAKTNINAHPHQDNNEIFSLVHNGIIDNYIELKNELETNHNIKFISQTDTEVIVNLISVLYNKYNDVEIALKETCTMMNGTWAILLLSKNHPDKIFCARNGSPLLIGFTTNYIMISSEQSGFHSDIKEYICLDNNDVITLSHDHTILDKYEKRTVIRENIATTPNPYPHWTIKEIHEQADSIKRAITNRLVDDVVILKGIEMHKKTIIDLDNIIILGCGTSYNAGLVGSYYLKEFGDLNVVNVYDGAEFMPCDIPKKGKTGAILISQSGETSDLHRCIEICKQNNVFTIGVINVVNSLISREVDCGIYTNTGKEFGVASTKAFTSQVVILGMLALWMAQNKNINNNNTKLFISNLKKLDSDIDIIINENKENAKFIANYLLNQTSCFVLGKNICEPAAREGSLKIKEIGYIHAEAYSSSALKHGPFAIIEPGLPIFLILMKDDYFVKNTSTSEEIKSRDAYVIGITDTNVNNAMFDHIITVPNNFYFRHLLSVIPMQLVAYELACLKGHNPDMPKNLAKCVTTH